MAYNEVTYKTFFTTGFGGITALLTETVLWIAFERIFCQFYLVKIFQSVRALLTQLENEKIQFEILLQKLSQKPVMDSGENKTHLILHAKTDMLLEMYF